MNTPKTPKPPKRWDNRAARLPWPVPDEGLSWDVKSREHLIFLGAIIVRFGHLEQAMENFICCLFNMDSAVTPGIVFGAIIAPKTRITVMRRLLEEAPENQHRSPEWDLIIDEYEAINKLRNKYVHGLWYTSDKTFETLVAPTDGEGLSHLIAKPVLIKQMKDLVDRMEKLQSRLLAWRNDS